MLNIIIFNLIAAVFLVMSSFFICRKIFKSNDSINFLHIILLIIFIIVSALIYSVDFSPIASLIVFLSMIIVYKIIFKLSLSKALTMVTVVLIVYMLADLVVGITISSIVGAVEMRKNIYIFMFCNILIAGLAYIVFFISFGSDKIMSFLNKVERNKYYDKVLFFVLIFGVLVLILYNISSAAKFSKAYLIDVIIMLFFFAISFIFVNEKLKKDKLDDDYNQLMDYVGTFEEWFDDEKINNHEYKNQLAVIRSMAKNNKKIINYIDEILNDDIDLEVFWLNEIKYLPAGGIKGLLYYKLLRTKKENIDICLSVSRDVKDCVRDVNAEELKNISRVLGIFLDNAIDAAKLSDNKIVSIEVYPMCSNLVIVISNTYSGDVSMKNIFKKGYTTKGKGHGYGLYFANKIIKKSNIMKSETSIINNYYVQKLIIIK